MRISSEREHNLDRGREIRIGEQEILARNPDGKKHFEMNVVEAKGVFNFEEEVGRSCKTSLLDFVDSLELHRVFDSSESDTEPIVEVILSHVPRLLGGSFW